MELDTLVGTGAASNLLPPVLTVEEIADLMRIDRKTAYTAIANGEIPGVRRLGRCIRVSRDIFLQWLAEGDGTQQKVRRQ
jgi:excisionase family DNA binding protein